MGYKTPLGGAPVSHRVECVPYRLSPERSNQSEVHKKKKEKPLLKPKRLQNKHQRGGFCVHAALASMTALSGARSQRETGGQRQPAGPEASARGPPSASIRAVCRRETARGRLNGSAASCVLTGPAGPRSSVGTLGCYASSGRLGLHF